MGLISLNGDGPVGDVNELLKLPLHEAVLVEFDRRKVTFIPDPLLLMLSRLGNLCILEMVVVKPP